MKPKRAVLYVRVSTEEQKNENQLFELEQLAKQRGWLVLGRLEDTISGAAAVRPGLLQVLELANRGAVDVVAVWALDRLGRNMQSTIRTVLELERVGVELVSLRESWLDTGGPVRSLLVAIFSWIAEQERTRLSERTHAGLARAKRNGVKLGRPGKVSIVQARALLDNEGLSLRAAAKRLGVSYSALQRVANDRARCNATDSGCMCVLAPGHGGCHFDGVRAQWRTHALGE